VIKQIVVIIEAYYLCQLQTKFCPTSLCAEAITGGHRCGFWRNRSTTDHILCICQI